MRQYAKIADCWHRDAPECRRTAKRPEARERAADDEALESLAACKATANNLTSGRAGMRERIIDPSAPTAASALCLGGRPSCFSGAVIATKIDEETLPEEAE